MRLEGKVALITGGGRGIGKSIALAYAKEGAYVAVSARTESQIESVAKEIRKLGQRALAIKADIRKEEDVKKMVGTVIQEFGKIDILVNNAGVTEKKPTKEIKDLPEEEWNRIIQTNLTGTFLCTKWVLPHMINRRSGNIINISSALGQKGRPEKENSVAYAVSKFGTEGFTEHLSKESKEYNINVNALYPGVRVDTGFFNHLSHEQREKLARPEIVAEPAIFLASQRPAAMSGKSINASRPIWK